MADSPRERAQEQAATVRPIPYHGKKEHPEDYVKEKTQVGPPTRWSGSSHGKPPRVECDSLVMDYMNQQPTKENPYPVDNWRQGTPLFNADGTANRIPENSPIATFGADHKFGHTPDGDWGHAAIFLYFIKKEKGPDGKIVRWDPEHDDRKEIIGTRIVEQIPPFYEGLTPHGYKPGEVDLRPSGHPVIRDALINDPYPHRMRNFSTIKDDRQPHASLVLPALPKIERNGPAVG